MKKPEIKKAYQAFIEDFKKSSTAPVLVQEPTISYSKKDKK
jgi:hypothetical protein